MKTKRLSLALAATFVLGACAEESTGPELLDQALTLNAALVAADATLEDITLARVPLGFVHGGLGLGPGGGLGPAGRPGGEKGIGGELSGTRTVTFYDAGGNVQAAYDSLTTASVHVVLDIAGEVERGPWSGSVKRTRDMTVSGLAGVEATRTFNGTGTEDVQRSRTLDDGTEASFDLEGSFTQENVVVPAPGGDKKYPLSGKITRQMSVTVVNGPKGDETRKVTVVITFDGDNTATAVVNGETHEIDLDARPGVFPLREGFGFGRGRRGP
ncbi:MAG: hypothetical protein FIA95_07560 [Gemmatimonadetes bacterium]|nr:hypothetical protein [Gemmatimonadota bacterium]